MLVVPILKQPKRSVQPQEVADPKFLLMAAALMHGEGKINPQLDQSQLTLQPQNPLG